MSHNASRNRFSFFSRCFLIALSKSYTVYAERIIPVILQRKCSRGKGKRVLARSAECDVNTSTAPTAGDPAGIH